MSGIIAERELMQASESDPTGVSVFGHCQVADTFLVICAMSRQERRVLATKLAAYDAPMADEFAQDIIDAVFDTGGERYQRLARHAAHDE